ncbi:GDYXXLXY domain-containing protein [Sinorhizobium sp. BG8]|uniref:GDYXXLXY domain-containing protein n=1 Tax=Sinorhizobium sp. BG8 TaxID=2613773 RepID=UPI00193CCEC8|nr:GDYXXLXY domain-containing protein [Sinorhizobium sp. BG8]QRM55383.1 GDYXXLXY domain-containing protein [Sinorhizobium sp. BG8]
MARVLSGWHISPVVAGLLVAVLQTAIIGYMVEGRASILRSGAEVRLKTLPVDPRDLLRGDYVVLSYPMSTIPSTIITGPIPSRSGEQRLNVRLLPGADGTWTASEASFADLAPAAGSVVVRSLPFEFYRSGEGGLPETLFVQYGIERYYVPEGEGRVLEDARNQDELEIDARVSASGEMQIARILLRGKPVYDEPLY